jgi:ComF family protein
MNAAHGAFVPCAACQQHAPPWTACAAPLHYEYPVDAALKALKFRQCLYFAPALAELLQPLLRERFSDVDALVPVPLHRWRQGRRGFNQAVELCRPLAKASGLPLLRPVRRIRATGAQTGLDRAARRRNLRAAFRASAPLRCRYPLIVDDVMTTGETCRQLAKVLLAAGAERVGVVTVARAATRQVAGVEKL